jgi:hypothetical protein
MIQPTQSSGPTISTEGTINASSVGMISYPVGPEDWFSMRHADWKRIRGRVEKLADPLPYMGQIGWACVGISTSAFLALIPWVPAYDQLSTAAHDHFSWVTPFLAIAGAFALVFAAFSLLVNMRMRQREKVILSSILSDMDSCYELHVQEKGAARLSSLL